MCQAHEEGAGQSEALRFVGVGDIPCQGRPPFPRGDRSEFSKTFRIPGMRPQRDKRRVEGEEGWRGEGGLARAGTSSASRRAWRGRCPGPEQRPVCPPYAPSGPGAGAPSPPPQAVSGSARRQPWARRHRRWGPPDPPAGSPPKNIKALHPSAAIAWVAHTERGARTEDFVIKLTTYGLVTGDHD